MEDKLHFDASFPFFRPYYFQMMAIFPLSLFISVSLIGLLALEATGTPEIITIILVLLLNSLLGWYLVKQSFLCVQIQETGIILMNSRRGEQYFVPWEDMVTVFRYRDTKNFNYLLMTSQQLEKSDVKRLHRKFFWIHARMPILSVDDAICFRVPRNEKGDDIIRHIQEKITVHDIGTLYFSF